jgi:eukaryotic-like serine/threonine-protein kinase
MAFTSQLKLEEVIGHGHFGDVHAAVDPLHGKVAVKVLRQLDDETKEEWEARKDDIMSEAQTLKAAEHPNVVRVLNICRHDEDNRLHMVCEFCDGGSVAGEYAAGPIPLHRVRDIITDVCLGLEAIHERQMIHRDIKPGNILRSGKTWKIGDFGLVSDSIIDGYASATGYSDHLPPEFWKRDITSTKTDVWALGMTVYRLLHGHPFYIHHFRQLNGPTVRELVENGGFASRLPFLHHIPNAWRKFIRKALHDETDRRFQSIFALSQALADLPVEPDWECDFLPNRTVWTREKSGRKIEVTWIVDSERKHRWQATSTGGQRNRGLGGGASVLSRSDLNRDLDTFFANSR